MSEQEKIIKQYKKRFCDTLSVLLRNADIEVLDVDTNERKIVDWEAIGINDKGKICIPVWNPK